MTVAGVTERLAAGGGTIRVPNPELWWPHTHGEPHLYELHVRAETGEAQRRIGFRALTYAADVERDGLDLHVNGQAVFVRGAVWTPTPRGEERATLERARDGGLNMVRVVGTMVYEDAAFHDACDELGILVWQDLMFANLDYPFDEPAFRALVDEEVRQALASVSGRPSLAVVCGNSEVEQQVAMLGLPPEIGSRRVLRRRAAGARPRGRNRRRVHPVGADRRSAAVPDRRGRRELLRRRCVPPAARRRSARVGPVRIGVPRVRQRPRRSAA